MDSLQNINKFLLSSFQAGSEYYDFHVVPLKQRQQHLPPDYKNIKEFENMLKIGEDCSENGGLSNFLFSTNDMKRNQLADDYADFLLFRVDLKDANYFRRGVNLREVGRDITYENQRDHASHTVFNYLLGWVFYQETGLRDKIDQVISHVKQQTINLRGESNRDFFGTMWSYVSLFHDIGYLFEGPLPGNNISFAHEGMTRGATWIHNFFLHRFWFEAEIDYISIRKILYKYLDIDAIDFDRIKSMIALGDIITSLYNINEIKKNVDSRNPGFFKPDYRNKNFNYWDAFKIWEIFYDNFFPNKFQLDRMKLLKKAYYENMYKGSEDFGSRTIDHGVASGLIMLLYNSYFYSIFFNLKNINTKNSDKDFKIGENTRKQWKGVFDWEGNHYLNPDQSFEEEVAVFERISEYILELPYPHYQYKPEWFFTGVLWGTSAAAIHNIQEVNPSKWFDTVHDKDATGALWIDDDPLAYLGILVDTLQAWDRFSVFPNPNMVKSVPFQSHDVFVKIQDRKLIIRYKNNPSIVKSVTNDLTRALRDWDQYVQIEC